MAAKTLPFELLHHFKGIAMAVSIR